ncbi:MAG: DedA family protein [Spongiibacteraceae bacterium]|nr:DedA family protein [Spongiibacteraceae bacterium]
MFEWITQLISQAGYVGIFLLMVLENVFPPIPSELIMPLAGYLAAKGELRWELVILAGTLGSYVGALPWYWGARAVNEEFTRRQIRRWGRWLTMSEQDFDQALDWFGRHGGKAVFFGRLVPAVRTLISVPAGLARMPFASFTVLTLAGSLIWTAILTVAGYVLNAEYHRVADYLDPGSTIVVALVILVYFYRLLRPAVR